MANLSPPQESMFGASAHLMLLTACCLAGCRLCCLVVRAARFAKPRDPERRIVSGTLKRQPTTGRKRMSSTEAHLWAVGYEDVRRARQVRDELNDLARYRANLLLLDVLIVFRNPDGSYTFDRQQEHSTGHAAGKG